MISAKNLTFSYSSQKNFSFPDIVCGDSETLLILGQSGRGKTTLLHLLALLLKPSGGNILIDGKDTTTASPSEVVKERAKNIGIIYQKAHFVSSLSVKDNLFLSNYLSGEPLNKSKVEYLADHLGFSDHLNKKPSQLSQGEQQRVSIARALMNTPRVILADEPTSSLDDANCLKVIDLLRTESEAIGASLLVVTHDQRLKDVFPSQILL